MLSGHLIMLSVSLRWILHIVSISTERYVKTCHICILSIWINIINFGKNYLYFKNKRKFLVSLVHLVGILHIIYRGRSSNPEHHIFPHWNVWALTIRLFDEKKKKKVQAFENAIKDMIINWCSLSIKWCNLIFIWCQFYLNSHVYLWHLLTNLVW